MTVEHDLRRHVLEALMAGDVPDLLAELVTRPAWQADALCREPEYRHVNFFPGRGEDPRPAKQVCARCLVADECVAYAMRTETVEGITGIWGGYSARERRQLRGHAA